MDEEGAPNDALDCMGSTLDDEAVDNGDMYTLSFSNSIRKRRFTKLKRDWARVPMTSAYKSVTCWLSEIS